VKRTVQAELAILRANDSRAKAELISEPPAVPTRAQLAILENSSRSGGALPAEDVHYKTGLVMTARRWLQLASEDGELIYRLTEAGADALESSRSKHKLPTEPE